MNDANNKILKKTKAYIRLGIKSNNLIPSEITSLLSVEPTKAWKKGDTYQSRYRNKDGSIGVRNANRPWGVWEISSDENIQSEEIEKHALYILNQLESSKENLSKLLKDPSLRVSIGVWWEPESGQGGFTLSAITMNKLSKLCNEIDFYFC